MQYEKDITDYILHNLPMDAERVYPRTTKNHYYIVTHGWQLWFKDKRARRPLADCEECNRLYLFHIAFVFTPFN